MSNIERLRNDPSFRELFRVARHRNVAKNRVVIREGTVPEHLYFLMSGLVSVRHTSERSHELLLAYLYPGDFFGEMCLFPGAETRSARVLTSDDCVLLEIPYQTFVSLTRQHPSLWLELAGQLAARLRATNRRLSEMPALHAADRVWLALTEMAANIEERETAEGRPIRITRQDLGKLVGCSRELAGMILTDFAREGRITLQGRTIYVPSTAASVRQEILVPVAAESQGPAKR